MPYAAATPSVSLLVGAAAGLFLPNIPRVPLLWLLLALSALSAWSWRASHTRVLVLGVIAGFLAGGALLSSSAWQRAWRPSLRIAFEALARDQRAQAVAEGRRVPEDEEAFATLEGELRADATPGNAGVTLSVDIDGLDGQEGREKRPVTGGVIVTVIGSLAGSEMHEWRAGRRVRLPVQ